MYRGAVAVQSITDDKVFLMNNGPWLFSNQLSHCHNCHKDNNKLLIYKAYNETLKASDCKFLHEYLVMLTKTPIFVASKSRQWQISS